MMPALASCVPFDGHKLHGYTPNGGELEIYPGNWLGEAKGTVLYIWNWEMGRWRFRCITPPEDWDVGWAMVAAWLVLTHKGLEGLDAWLDGEPVTISPMSERKAAAQ